MRVLLFLALTISPCWLAAQPDHANICAPATAQVELDANNIRALLLNGGDLFWDFDKGRFIPGGTAADEASTIFTAALWIGGVDPGGNLKLAAQDNPWANHHDYWPGPLDSAGITLALTCTNWDRIFKITGAEIAAFLGALPLTQAEAIAAYPAVMGWPGAGNPYFEAVQGFALPVGQSLAPFVDSNNDDIYDPLDGDFPAVRLSGQPGFVPTQILWTVFNDHGGGQPHTVTKGKAIQAEVQLTAWAFHASGDPVLHNTVFTQHKVINRGSESIDSLAVGLWADLELGCWYDDYFASKPDLSTFFVYNQDAIDGQPFETCDGTATFGDNPPMQSVTFLNVALDHFTYYNNPWFGIHPPGTGIPDQPDQFYNYLTGRWRDGTPMYEGGTGYQSGTQQVDHAFSGDPADPGSWSMCSANLPVTERCVVGSHKFGLLPADADVELVAAWIHHPQTDYQPCTANDLVANVQTIRDLYSNGFATVVSAPVPPNPADGFLLFPNPADRTVSIRAGELKISRLRLFRPDGTPVIDRSVEAPAEMVLTIGHLPAGRYLVEVTSPHGVQYRPLVVVK